MQSYAFSLMVLPMRCMGDEPHHDTGDKTGGRHSDEPAQVDPTHHAPVDGAPVTVAKTHANDSTGYALSRGNR